MKRFAMKKGFYLFHFGIDGVYEGNKVLQIERLVTDTDSILKTLRDSIISNIEEEAKKALSSVDLNKTIIYSVSYLGDEEW